MKLEIAKIKIVKELYPRDKINEGKVEEYSQYISVLPPIIVNQDNILIDGAHRLYAYKKKDQREIECVVVETKDDDDLFLKAVEFNAKHGYQMTQKEKKSHVIKLYEKTLNNNAKTFDVERIKQTFSIPDKTFATWTKDLSDELESQKLQKILKLHLKCLTQTQIGLVVGLAHNSVSDKIKEIEELLSKLSENAEWQIPTKYEFLREKIGELSEFSPLLYNIWSKSAYDGDNEHFGKFPFEFMENILYYYTEPFDIVFDPFVGGCTTIDVCKKWLRRYVVSDLTPIETRKDEIIKHDINDSQTIPLPNNTKLVFLDPPYWKQALNKYSKDKKDLGNVDLISFYKSIEELVKSLKTKMKSGYVAFVIQPTQWSNENRAFEDHIITVINLFHKSGFKEVMRYNLPYSSQQYNAQQVEIAKKEKICLNLIRDLVIFKKN